MHTCDTARLTVRLNGWTSSTSRTFVVTTETRLHQKKYRIEAIFFIEYHRRENCTNFNKKSWFRFPEALHSMNLASLSSFYAIKSNRSVSQGTMQLRLVFSEYNRHLARTLCIWIMRPKREVKNFGHPIEKSRKFLRKVLWFCVQTIVTMDFHCCVLSLAHDNGNNFMKMPKMCDFWKIWCVLWSTESCSFKLRPLAINTMAYTHVENILGESISDHFFSFLLNWNIFFLSKILLLWFRWKAKIHIRFVHCYTFL